nr:endonuclease/exonuclease/phosphatase family protein [Oceanusvirus sp.]
MTIIVENPPSRSPDPTSFVKAVGSKGLEKLADSIKKRGCLAPELTLYDVTAPQRVKGWNVRVVKRGTVFFKAFPGFITSEQLDGYAAANASQPSWFGNAAVSFTFASRFWGGMVAFVASRDIRVLDWYDSGNMNRVIDIIKRAGMKKEAEHIRITSGFMSLEDQRTAIVKMYRGKWNVIYMFTKEVPPELNVSRCSPATLEDFNPLAITTLSFVVDKAVWPILLADFSKADIHGFIRRNVRSSVEETGVMYQEELVMKGGLFGTSFVEKEDHPLHWKSWAVSDRYEGLMLRMRLPKRPFTNPTETPNDDFALLQYVESTRDADPKGTSMGGVVTYNVAGFRPPDASLDEEHALSWLAEAVKKCHRAFAFALQEVPIVSVPAVRQMFSDNGLVGFSHVRNGGPAIAVCLAVRWKDVRIDRLRTKGRTQLVADTPKGRICAVHLDIGDRRKAGKGVKSENEKIDRANARLRIETLRSVVGASPDIVLGDFNFAPGDPEDKFMASKGYDRATPDLPKTTPHNRVDHVFVRRGTKTGKTLTVPSSASDHSMVFQQWTPRTIPQKRSERT